MAPPDESQIILGYITEQFLSEPPSLQWDGGGVGHDMFEHGIFGLNMWSQSNQMPHIANNWELPVIITLGV